MLILYLLQKPSGVPGMYCSTKLMGSFKSPRLKFGSFVRWVICNNYKLGGCGRDIKKRCERRINWIFLCKMN